MAARKARKISIHALREEGDSLPVSLPQLNVRISIHALREEGDPDASLILGRVIAISIHALREEGDDLGPRDRRSPSNFYPRPPRGGRQRVCQALSPCLFISIHALREEGDSSLSLFV